MDKKIDLSIIIISYNTEKFLENCLQSIKVSNKGRYSWETIVVDNASIDGSVLMLKKFRNNLNLQVVENKKNLGFAAANNIGIRKSYGRYILFLNPDTILPRDTLLKMLDFMEENLTVGVSSPRVELVNGDLDYASHRGFPTPWNSFCYFSGLQKLFPRSHLFAGYTMGWLLESHKPHEVDSVVGAFLLVRRVAGEQIGWWDEDYFWYGDELDLCYRLKEKGWKTMFIPDVRMIHYKGVSSGIQKQTREISTATKETRLKAAKASTEAMKIFYKKHYSEKYPEFITWLVLNGISFLQTLRLVKYSF